MMIVAELEVYHSRPVAPTRRVALGHLTLPVDPPPGFGGVLLGGIVAHHIGSLDPDLLPDLHRLTLQLENGQSIPQPRLRYRLQRDKVGLQLSTHRLVGHGDELRFDFAGGDGLPTQHLLAAVYAAGQLPVRARPPVMGAIRRAAGWQGSVGPELIAALAGFGAGSSLPSHALSHPVEWALEVLGLANREAGATTVNGSAGPRVSREGIGPSRKEIQQAYRRLLIEAHPDHGGRTESAARRIAELTEARRILLG